MAIRSFNSIEGFSVSSAGVVVINSDGNVTANALVANGNVTLSIANVTANSNSIFRDSFGLTGAIFQSNTAPTNPKPGDEWFNTENGILFKLIDDGTTIQWVDISGFPGSGGGGGDGTPGGSNTQIQFNNDGAFGGSANLTFNSATGILAVNGNITAANITANTGVFTGNGSGLTALNASNISTGTIPAARLSGTYTITVTGSATTAGTVTTAAQPNITSVGTLTSLGVSGNITAANITANTGVFTGNGSGLTALNASNISTGTVPTSRLASGSANANTYLRGDGVWAAPITVSTTAPGSPVLNQLWLDIS